MKRASVGAFVAMLAIFGAAYVAVSLDASNTGPVNICTAYTPEGEFCLSTPAQTFIIVCLWLSLGLAGMSVLIRKIRQSISSNGSKAEP